MLSENANSVLLLAAVALLVYVLMRRAGSGARQSLAEPPLAGTSLRRSAPRLDAASGEAPVELLRWQVEMHDTARELKGELDAKLAGLQALVIMARQEAARLEAALKRVEHLELPPPHDTLARLEGLADARALSDEGAVASLARQLPPLLGAVPGDLFSRDEQSLAISNLAKQGLAPAEIASRLGLPLGEVELLLSLRPA